MGNSGSTVKTTPPVCAERIPTFKPPKPVCLEGIPTWKTYFENNLENLIKRLPPNEEDFEYDAEIISRVSLYKGDIAALKVDAIVGSSNNSLDATAGVSERIADVAGSQLKQSLATLNGCKTGESKVTLGYNLPAEYAIFTVGPSGKDPVLLESCYKSCLENMQQHEMKSLAFCCISTGINGYPENEAVLIALKTVRKWMDKRKQHNTLSEIDRIIFCLHKDTEVILYENWMQVFFPCRPKTKEPSHETIFVTKTNTLKLADNRQSLNMSSHAIEEIPTWQTYFEKNEEILINRVIPKGEEDFEFDKDINAKVSLCKGDITGIQDGINSANKGNFVTSEGVMVQTIGPDVETNNEASYRHHLYEMLWNQKKFLVFRFTSTDHAENNIELMLKTVRQWLNSMKNSNRLSNFDRIIFCLYTPGDVVLCEDWMQVYFPCCPKSEMDLLPLPGYVTITVTEPDMLDIDEGRRQAKMPCGHVIGRDSMTEHCRDVLRRGQFQFFCPATGTPPCNAHWEYFIVRHVARLTADELTELEKKISDNYLMKAKGMQRCPGCQTYCYRGDGVGAAVRCPICTKNYGRNFDFCWWCQGKWLSSSSSPQCGNPGCDGNDRRLQILANCPTKSINNCKNCPSIRGCPKCGLLIEHKDKCAHVNCKNCSDYGFCFICLKEQKDGKWQCSPWTGTCVLQPRQTTLPGSK